MIDEMYKNKNSVLPSSQTIGLSSDNKYKQNIDTLFHTWYENVKQFIWECVS